MAKKKEIQTDHSLRPIGLKATQLSSLTRSWNYTIFISTSHVHYYPTYYPINYSPYKNIYIYLQLPAENVTQ